MINPSFLCSKSFVKSFSLIICMLLIFQFVFCFNVNVANAAEWTEGTSYSTGEIVSYNGTNYVCLVGHTAWSGAGWNPASTPSLWSISEESTTTPSTPTVTPGTTTPTVTPGTTAPTATPGTTTQEPVITPGTDIDIDITEWTEGTSYSAGEIVSYNGTTYECLVGHTAWVGTGWNPASTPSLWKVSESGSAIVTPTVTPITTPVVTELPTETILPTSVPTPTPTPNTNPGVSASWGTQIFAPYVDVMLWPTPDINEFMTKTGNPYYTLAFILSNGGVPSWGGITPYTDEFYMEQIQNIRAKGGDVIISFGGANGTELALEITDVNELQAAYQAVIDMYDLTWVDFDIEGTAVTDNESISRRNQAIVGLQKNNPNLTIAYCLPVMPEGLTSYGINVLKDALIKGVRVDVVNLMTMDYGGAYSDDMGDYAIQAAENTYEQLKDMGMDAKIGNTPMIGQNDVSTEIFQLSDAQQLLTWAQNTDYVRLLSMWSITRDNSTGTALYNSTMIEQKDYDFTNIFKAFNSVEEIQTTVPNTEPTTTPSIIPTETPIVTPVETPIVPSTNTKKRVVAYFPEWGVYNVAHDNVEVGDIPWDKITHVNHAFLTIDTNYQLQFLDTWAELEKIFEHSSTYAGHIGEYQYYKGIHPEVKICPSVGGWTRGENFHAMALSSTSRSTFINSCIDFLKTYSFFDGIDLDWEYPGVNRDADYNDSFDRGCPGGPEDTENFTLLLKEMREAFDTAFGKGQKLITIAAPADPDKIALQQPDKYYKYLDFINVMTYDYHGAWDNQTNHNSPLYENPSAPLSTWNTEKSMLEFVSKGVPSNMLNVGSPFYSRGWGGVSNTAWIDPSTETSYPGLFQTSTGNSTINEWGPGGQNSYAKMKELENTFGYAKYRDPYTLTPYLYNSSTKDFYSYEDEISLQERCDFINENGYGGIIIWEVSGDIIDGGYPMFSIVADNLL